MTPLDPKVRDYLREEAYFLFLAGTLSALFFWYYYGPEKALQAMIAFCATRYALLIGRSLL